MFFKQISCGGDRNFGYIIADEKTNIAAVVDPSPDPGPVIRELEHRGFLVEYVICTHDHYDHTGGNGEMKRRFSVKTVFHSSAGTGDVHVADGDVLTVGNLSLQVLHTPGHTPDSISVLAGDNLVAGDFLFVGKVGGTYSREDARVQFDQLKRVMTMDPNIRIWPGHDVGVKVSSTIGEEKKANPFCLRLHDFEEFYHLKQNWPAYKKEHGIN